MKSSFLTVAILFASLLGPIAAFADGKCVLSIFEGIASNRLKAISIVAENLSVPKGGKEIWYKSNDGTLKIQVIRTDARADGAEQQVNVLLNDAVIMKTASVAHGDFVGSQNAIALPDGTALSLSCIAQVR